MDPELKKLLDRYTQKYPNASDDELKGLAQQFYANRATSASASTPDTSAPAAQPQDSFGSGLVNSIYQGLTLHWGDELMSKLLGPEAGAEVNRREAAFHASNPKSDIAAQILPSVGLAMATGGASAAPEAGVWAAAKRGALTSALFGAVNGAGSGTDLNSRATDAAVGAGLGAGLGAAIPGAAALIPYLRNAPLARLASVIRSVGGTDVLGNTLDNLVANGRGNAAMLGDLAPELGSEMDFAATNSPSVRAQLGAKVGARVADASDRIQQDFVGALNGNPSLANRVSQLKNFKQAWANDAYGDLPLDEEVPNGTLQDALGPAFNRPAIKNAIARARLAGDLTTDDPITTVVNGLTMPGEPVQPGEATQVTTPRPMTWDDLHQLQQELDDRAGAAFRAGKGKLGAAYRTLRGGVMDALDQNVEGYSDVTKQYAQLSGLQRAVVAGGKAWNSVDSQGLESEFASLSPAQQNEYRMGLAARALDALRNKATNRNAAAEYVNASPNLEAKLRIIFGDDDTFKQFMQGAQAEAQFNTMNNAGGNSMTAARESAKSAAQLPITAMAAIAHGVGGSYSLPVMIGLGQRSARDLAARNMAAKLGPLLMSQGPAAIRDVLNRAGNVYPGPGGVLGVGIPVGVSAAINNLFNPPQQP